MHAMTKPMSFKRTRQIWGVDFFAGLAILLAAVWIAHGLTQLTSRPATRFENARTSSPTPSTVEKWGGPTHRFSQRRGARPIAARELSVPCETRTSRTLNVRSEAFNLEMSTSALGRSGSKPADVWTAAFRRWLGPTEGRDASGATESP